MANRVEAVAARPMIEFYPQVRLVHILAVALSGSLFALRGVGMLAGMRWPQSAMVRYLSYGIDTVLLTAALMLVAMLPAALFANHWLAVKLVLVVAYVVLGVFALHRGRTRAVRATCYFAALSVFVIIIGIARMHHPLGWLLPWFA